MAFSLSLARPPAPSHPRSLTHRPSALVSLVVSPSCHLHWSLSLSPHPFRTRRSTHHSSFAHLKPETGYMQVEEKEEDLIRAIEVELASLETCLMDTAALFESLMLVDLMERLGIQRYFEHQIQRILRATYMWDPSLINDLPLHKLIFEGIDATCLGLAVESNRIQGCDILPLLKHLWAEFAAAFLKEAEWMHSEHIPGYEEYMKCAVVSVGTKVITWTSAFQLGEKMTEEILSCIGPDSRFMYLVCVVARLTNDVATFQREVQEGKLATGVACYMRDHPGCTQEEAKAGLVDFIELAKEELEWELYRSRAVTPEFCSRAVLNVARNAGFLYKRMDALTNFDEEFMKLFQDFAFNPVA